MGGLPASSPAFPHSLPLLFFFTFPCVSSSDCFVSPGKDARLFVFRLSAVQKGIEGKQAAWGRCDCRENKLEKTKGDAQRCVAGFGSGRPGFPETSNEEELGLLLLGNITKRASRAPLANPEPWKPLRTRESPSCVTGQGAGPANLEKRLLTV